MIVGAITPGGRLILSGILAEEEAVIVKTFTHLGLAHLKTARRGKWAAVMMERR